MHTRGMNSSWTSAAKLVLSIKTKSRGLQKKLGRQGVEWNVKVPLRLKCYWLKEHLKEFQVVVRGTELYWWEQTQQFSWRLSSPQRLEGFFAEWCECGGRVGSQAIRNVRTSSSAEERVMVDGLYPIASFSPGLCFHNSLPTIHSWNFKKNKYFLCFSLSPSAVTTLIESNDTFFPFLLSLMLHHPCTLKQV